MSLSFILLVLASVILRHLSAEAKRAFAYRLRALLPRDVLCDHLQILLKQHRNRMPEFRTRALPMHAAHLALDAFSCATLLTALWLFPPSVLAGFELAVFKYAGLAVVLLALTVELVLLCRLACAAWISTPPETPNEPPAEVD